MNDKLVSPLSQMIRSIVVPSALIVSFLVFLTGHRLLSVAAMPKPMPAQLSPTVEQANREDPTDRLNIAGIDNPQAVRDFLEQLRSAATHGDRQTLVELVRFPFTTYDAGTAEATYNTPEELLLDYDQVFTPSVLEAMRHAQYEQLFVNWQGVMIGNGEVWFDQREDGMKIKAINAMDE